MPEGTVGGQRGSSSPKIIQNGSKKIINARKYMETIYKLVCMSNSDIVELLTNENNNMVSQQGAKRPFLTPKLAQNIIISQKNTTEMHVN